VIDRIGEYLTTSDVQLGATYDVSQLGVKRVAMAARSVAELINAENESEVILGASTSMLLRILALCLTETFKPGDEVIVTDCDHEANIGPWVDMEKKGINVKVWHINPETLNLHLDDLALLMNEKTRLVAVTHASNILGTLNPIKKIASFVHERGAKICVDGVSYAPHRLVDVKELDVDFYAFSFYKVYGPHYAVLYGKKSHLLNMPGWNHFFIGQEEIPHKFQPGGINFELSYSLLGLCDYLTDAAKIHAGGQAPKNLNEAATLAYRCFAEHEEALSEKLLDYLNSKPNVRIIGKKEAGRKLRVPTISFVVDNRKSSSITEQVDKYKIGIRYGHFYAKRLIDNLGLAPMDGVVRVSMVHYNTLEEVDRLIRAFDNIL
jgi:cysteine desulfurase family protein (TIGR01976 family)